MTDPLEKAVSRAPATLGEGCLSRYDPDSLGPEDGTEFPDAAALWRALHPLPLPLPLPLPESAPDESTPSDT